MVLRNTLEEIGNRASQQYGNISTEEATKHALILPFIQSLGYNVFDPSEVIPEFTADHGLKAGEKVDYAIKRDNELVMLFECKKVGDPLDSRRESQLARYFVNTPARISVLTDGVVYKFFSDLDAENVMDEFPFLEIDLTWIDNREIQALGHFTKQSFDLEQALSTASNMKHITGMKAYLTQMLGQPDEEFVRLLARRVFSGVLVQSRMEHFTGLTKMAFQEFVNELINDTLRRAADMVNSESPVPDEATENDGSQDMGNGRKNIVTTVEEVEAYELIKAIVSECVLPERVFIRDAQSYCAILLDDNNRKTICRLNFTLTVKRLTVIGKDDEVRGSAYTINSVNDISSYAGELRAAVNSYL